MSHKLSAVLLPVGSGKSRLAGELTKFKHKKRSARFIDLDLYAEKNIAEVKTDLPSSDTVGNAWELKVFPKVKEQLDKDINNFPKDLFIVTTSNQRLLKYLKVEQVVALVPGTELFISDVIKGKSESEVALLIRSRESFYKLEKWSYYQSWDELLSSVVKAFDLTPA